MSISNSDVNNPIVLSFDVGVIHLAYCLFTKENGKLKIIEWDNIDLTDREFTKCHCGLKASFINNNNYYCKVHSKKINPLEEFDVLFKENISNNCVHLIKDHSCNRKSAYEYSGNYLCSTHSKTKYKSLQSLCKNKPFKNKSVGSLDFDETKLKLFQILEEKKELLKADIVLIENQPSFKNPTMKSISISLYDFYLIRGIMDKEITKSNITKVKFMSPSNKLKLVDEGETKKIVIAKATNESIAYKLTKQLSIKYTRELIVHLPDWLLFLNSKKKLDDLCDAFLQGCYYYEKNF
jgi:hypothetical protein